MDTDFIVELRSACVILRESKTAHLGHGNGKSFATHQLKRQPAPEEKSATSTDKDDPRIGKLEQELAMLKRKLAVVKKGTH